MQNQGELEGIIWWSCFLDSRDKFYDHLSDVGRQLHLKGQKLIVIGPPGDFSRCNGFTHLEVPISLAAQGKLSGYVPGPTVMPMTATAVPELMDAERLWCGGTTSPEAEFDILRAVHYWERAFEIMRPSVILAWGSTLPFSKLLLRLGQLTQTPTYAAERGLTENTLMINLFGQAQMSNIGVRLQFIDPIIQPDELDSEWSEIEKYYLNISTRNYASANNIDITDDIRKDKESIVALYLGTFDAGSGICYDSVRSGDRYTSWIRSSQEGAIAVAESLQRKYDRATLVVKSHPATRFDLPDNYQGIRVLNRPNTDFGLLLANADVCITSISTTQIYGFIYDKPIITLANGVFAGRNITYEANNADSLDDAMIAAINRTGWQEKRLRAKQLITALFREEFIGLTDDVPGRIKLAHMVEHLARFVNYRHPETKSVSERIAQFDAFQRWVCLSPEGWSISDIRSTIGQAKWQEIEEAVAAEFVARLFKSPDDNEPLQTKGVDATARSVAEEVIHRVSAPYELKLEQLQQKLAILEHDSAVTRDLFEDLQAARVQSLIENGLLRDELSKAKGTNLEASRDHESALQTLTIEIFRINEFLNAARHRNVELSSENKTLKSLVSTLWLERKTLANWIYEVLKKKGRRGPLFNWFKGAQARESMASIDAVEYLLANPDVADAGYDPEYHWLRYGRQEGRSRGQSPNHEIKKLLDDDNSY